MKLLREYVNGFELPRLKEANIRGRERYVQRQHAISGSLLIFWNRMPIFLSSLDSPGIYLFNEVNQGRERDNQRETRRETQVGEHSKG